jgi:hypothetical protein
MPNYNIFANVFNKWKLLSKETKGDYFIKETLLMNLKYGNTAIWQRKTQYECSVAMHGTWHAIFNLSF